jgi:hypothetical protein
LGGGGGGEGRGNKIVMIFLHFLEFSALL